MNTMTSHFNEKPHTKLGWWAAWLGIAFVVLFLINSLVFMSISSDAPWRHLIIPFYGIFMLLCGLASGVIGLIAIIRGERSWAVLSTLLPGLWVLFMVIGEFLFPH